MNDLSEDMNSFPNNSKMKYQSSKQIFVPVTNEKYKNSTNYIKDNCIPSNKCARSYINRFFPFLTWLQYYDIGWIPHDLLCGVTVSIIYISQGMAYALLANVPAIIGLYMSFFPPLIYALFGTSRHVSIGGIAVISLMTGNVVNSFTIESSSTIIQTNITDNTIRRDYNEVTIVMALSFTVGLIQLILSIFRFGFVTVFLSDTFISGYTASTAVLVLTSQMPDFFGIKIQHRTGFFKIVYIYIELFKRLRETNLITLTISISGIITIYTVKEYLEPYYKRMIKKWKIFHKVQIPIPIELIVIIIGTILSHKFHLNSRYNVKTIKTIGKGFRAPEWHQWKLLPLLVKESISIAIVSYAISYSLAKNYAKQLNYIVDANQELSAYGLCNIICSFFGCYPSASSLARTSVCVNLGGRTQLVGIISSIFLLITILKIGPLLEPMPKACLVAIIIVSLRNLLMKVRDIFTIGRVTKLETIVWISTFFSTIILDVDYGLIVGICVSFIVVILYHFRPRTFVLGVLDDNQVHNMSRHYSNARELPNIKILRFESPIMYFNGEYFNDSILKLLRDESKTNEKKLDSVNEKFIDDDQNGTHVIVDCSAISQIDYSGGKIFIQTIKELNDHKYKSLLGFTDNTGV
ncbi:unnamed protein product [Rotaria sordida]|uniref:STAS domain-containing protein n=1 Tax=Rotaria sordida TaxID=392033 RepID=A0A819JBD6_9BILA|nr:unnamed protein product [Rotaria sordida]